MKVLFILLLFPLICISQQSNCAYSDLTPPAAGVCSGPITRTAARRAATPVNRGCASDQVFYAKDGNPRDIRCGACIPGTDGNWRFTGVTQGYMTDVQTCDSQSRICSAPQLSATNPLLFCGVNEYCTDDAQCADITTSPLYMTVCNDQLPCGPGLSCLAGRCQICLEGKQPPVSLTQDAKLLPMRCVNGKFVTTEWGTFLYAPDTAAAAVVLLFGVVLLAVQFGYCIAVVRCCKKRVEQRILSTVLSTSASSASTARTSFKMQPLQRERTVAGAARGKQQQQQSKKRLVEAVSSSEDEMTDSSDW
eukprot:TRINITY_DN2965_c0_g2_i1.p1 TRINITY_DN2965_c0_g2~~TRINITY_DN2965_c0_g2_i1.p1  ORF type:complete len:306 (+),score=48.81 TRINITY_DN2965_c0_g2_i1:39-956(+)